MCGGGGGVVKVVPVSLVHLCTKRERITEWQEQNIKVTGSMPDQLH